MARPTPLHVAVEAGDRDEVQRLLEGSGKSMLNANEGELWRTPLHLACIHGHLDLVRPLINQGADANAEDFKFDTPLILAIKHKNFEVASMLVKEFHCDPNARNKYGIPLIHSVYSEGNFDGIRFLVGHGANVNSKDTNKDTLLTSAVKNWSPDKSVLKLLVEFKCDPNITGQNGMSPLQIACAENNPILALTLVEHGAHVDSKDGGDTPLMLAVKRENCDVVKTLLWHSSCDPDAADESGMSPLHVACNIGTSVDLVKLLASHSKDVNLRDRNMDTPLILAVRNTHLEVVLTLLDEFKCDFNLRDKEEMTPLHIACCKCSLPMAEILINRGAGVNTKDLNNNSPLVLAVRNNNDRVALALLEAGSDPNTVDEEGMPPLHIACSMGSHMVRYLANYGANLNARDLNKNTPFSLAVASEKDFVAQLLLKELKCDVNTVNNNGISPLHIACNLGNLSLVRDMMMHGADVLVKNSDNNTPLTLAAWCGKYKVVLALLDEFHCNPDVKGERGMTLLHIASSRGILTLVQSLANLGADVNIKDDGGNTPFMIAVKGEKLEVALALLNEFKCDPYATDNSGCSPLQLACDQAKFGLIQALLGHGMDGIGFNNCYVDKAYELAFKYGKYKLVLALIKAFKSQCDPDIKNDYGVSLLHMACSKGNLSLVQALIESGANLNLRDNDYNTPLVLAAKNNMCEVTLALLGDSRCDPNLEGEHGMSPLHIACRNGNINLVRNLIHRGADPCAKNSRNHMPLPFAVWNDQYEIAYELLKECGSKCDPDILYSDNQTLMHRACLGGHVHLIQLLIQHGSLLSALDKNGDTPLAVAVKKGKIEAVLFLLNQPACDCNTQNMLGMTPLHIACKNGSLDQVNALIDHGADVKIRDVKESTPLNLAVLNNQYDIVLALLQAYGRKCDLDTRYSNQQTLLHKACSAGHLGIVLELEKHGSNFIARDGVGDTPLSVAVQEGQDEIVLALLKDFKCDPNIEGGHSRTPLHLACKVGKLSLVRILMEHGACLTAKDSSYDTPLTLAVRCKMYVAAIALIEEFKGDTNIKGAAGESVLHIVCADGKIELVHRLIQDFKADVNSRDDSEGTPLMKAVRRDRAEVVRALISDYGCDVNMQWDVRSTLLHLAALEGSSLVLELLITEFGMSVSLVDSEGNTPLHIAARTNRYKVAKNLLLDFHSPAYIRNENGATAFDIADGRIRSLFSDSALQKSVEADYKTMQQLAEKRYSGSHRITRLFVVGHPGAGKSSLVEALKREGFFDSVYGRVSESSVPLHTAGIVPSIYTSEKYGRVQFYDFAGDPEYYSSHAAILERLFVSEEGSNICIIVLDLQESNAEIERKYLYWSAFVNHNSKNLQQVPSVIVVGSHFDLLSNQSVKKSKASYVESLTEKYHASHTSLPLDCCKTSSRNIKALRQLIQDFSSRYERYSLSYEESILLGLLEKDFSNVTACTASTIADHISQVNLLHLPRSLSCLYPVLKQLQAIGALLILGGKVQDSYLVLNVSQLTNEVHKKLFSEEASSLKPSIESFNIGLLSQSLLQEILPPYITKDCLVQLQYCQEISHIEIGQDFSISQTSEIPAAPNKSLLYFPALCRLAKRNVTWFLPPEDNYSIGWLARCSNRHDYFPSRFLHVLLLRIALRFTLVASPDLFPEEDEAPDSQIHMKRLCKMWKTGVHWLAEEGVECEVDVDNSREVVVGVRCEENSKVCLTMFNSIVSCIMEAKAEFCHSIQLKFFLLDKVGSLSDDNLHRLEDVERILNEGKPKIVSIRGDTWMSSSKLLHIRKTYWNSVFSMDERLILGYVETLVNEWFQLGEYLELPSSILRTIEANFPHDVVRQKLEMVRTWLSGSHTNCPPCWWSLVKALREIGENVCAASILNDQGENIIGMQRKLLEPEFQCMRPDDEFLQLLSKVIGSKWPYLATLLSLNSSEIEELREEEEGLSQVDHALMMLKKWSSREGAAYGQLFEKLKPVSLFQLSR